MIEIEQSIEATGVRFRVSGEKSEVLYIQNWLASYKQEDKIQIEKVPTNPTDRMRAEVFIDSDVDVNLNRIDFAALFKLTFVKFELNLPDASNTESDFMSKLNALQEMVQNALDSEEDFGFNIINQARKEAGF